MTDDDEAGPPVELDSPYDFETHLINPASEKGYDWLNRDAVLGNITDKQLFELRLNLELVQLLDYLNLEDAKAAFLADAKALLVISRSREGFWTRMMRTSISELKGYRPEDVEKKGFKWLFKRKP